MVVSRLKSAIAGFNKSASRDAKDLVIVVVVFLCVGGTVGVCIAIGGYRFNHLSSAEHLRRAREACGSTLERIHYCSIPSEAREHLEKIPNAAPEYREASTLLALIQKQEQQERVSLVKAQEQAAHLDNQSLQESKDQMWRNVQGTAHDGYICDISAEKNPIMSFDNGHYWWTDDGRCAAEEQKKQEQEQRSRDEAAQLSSYWPTTIRVDTDMDSSWLAGEERVCQTFPDKKGSIAGVVCNPEETHRSHNIPVKFWGGVDRNTISRWNCRRNKDFLDDQFVCRAID